LTEQLGGNLLLWQTVASAKNGPILNEMNIHVPMIAADNRNLTVAGAKMLVGGGTASHFSSGVIKHTVIKADTSSWLWPWHKNQLYDMFCSAQAYRRIGKHFMSWHCIATWIALGSSWCLPHMDLSASSWLSTAGDTTRFGVDLRNSCVVSRLHVWKLGRTSSRDFGWYGHKHASGAASFPVERTDGLGNGLLAPCRNATIWGDQIVQEKHATRPADLDSRRRSIFPTPAVVLNDLTT
jgi:hypothetical protein